MSASSSENSASNATSVFSWKGLRSYVLPMEANVSDYEKKCEADYVGSVSLTKVLEQYCGGSEYHYGVNSTFWRLAVVRNCNSHHVATVEQLLKQFKTQSFMVQYIEDQSRLLRMIEMLEAALPADVREPAGYISRIITATRKYTAAKWPGETAEVHIEKMASSPQLMFAAAMQPMDLGMLEDSVVVSAITTGDISDDSLGM